MRVYIWVNGGDRGRMDSSVPRRRPPQKQPENRVSEKFSDEAYTCKVR